MIIVQDSREQRPFTFAEYECQVQVSALPAGDYSVLGFEDRVAIERKNGIDELVMCLSSDRERFERELTRARAYERFYVVIEGHLHDVLAGRYRSKMSSKSVIASIAAFTNRYGIPFLFCGGRGAAEMMTFQFLQKFLYEIEKRYEVAKKGQEKAA